MTGNPILIRHTALDGTLLYGAISYPYSHIPVDDGFRRASVLPTDPHWGKACMYIPNSRDHVPHSWEINNTARRLRERGFSVTVEINPALRPPDEIRADLTRKLEASGKKWSQASIERVVNRRAGIKSPPPPPRDVLSPRGRPMNTDAGGPAIEKRIDRMQKELQAIDHDLPSAPMSSLWRSGLLDRQAYLVVAVKEWTEKLVAMIESGEYRPWQPDDFAPGDMVRREGSDRFFPVVRVNVRSLVVQSGLRNWNIALTKIAEKRETEGASEDQSEQH